MISRLPFLAAATLTISSLVTPWATIAVEPTPVLESSGSADHAAEMTSYSDRGLSIDFPADWEIEVVDDQVMITSVTTVESELIATQVVRMAASPGAVVNANIDSFIAEGSRVGRYKSDMIDGQEALMMWLSERPDSATGLTSAIATFIGYGDETIFLFSRYSPDNESAEGDILRLHSSFANLAGDVTDDRAEDESTPSTE